MQEVGICTWKHTCVSISVPINFSKRSLYQMHITCMEAKMNHDVKSLNFIITYSYCLYRRTTTLEIPIECHGQ